MAPIKGPKRRRLLKKKTNIRDFRSGKIVSLSMSDREKLRTRPNGLFVKESTNGIFILIYN